MQKDGAGRRSVAAAGGTLEYTLERKKVRNINLRVKPDGSLAVSAPVQVPLAAIDGFVRERAGWIAGTRQRLAQLREGAQPPHTYRAGELFWLEGRAAPLRLGNGSGAAFLAADGLWVRVPDPEDGARIRRALDLFFRAEAARCFRDILEEQYAPFAAMGIARPTLRLRWMTSRWGSCNPGTGSITLNTRLVCAPRECIEAVALHELCHLRCPDHSARFYALMGSILPQWRERKQLLEHWAALGRLGW